MTATNDIEHLSVDECWSLLRTATVGRLAVVIDEHPEIFPLNYVVDQGTVVFRTGEGSKVLGVLSGAPVAFEADGYDETTNEAWSVVLRGHGRTISEVHQVMETVDLPLYPWHGGEKSRYVRITPDAITGRRFTVVDPSTWTTTQGAHRAPSE